MLITHGPPRGCLDRTGGSLAASNKRGRDGDAGGTEKKLVKAEQRCGSEALAERVQHLPNLKLHIFGHVHASQNDELQTAGETSAETPRSKHDGRVLFVNAAAEQLFASLKWKLAEGNPRKALRDPFVLGVAEDRRFAVDPRGCESGGSAAAARAPAARQSAACVYSSPGPDPIG